MASSAAAVGWQIDIPSLSQLIVNVGAYGLKQLALAGVDVHSIRCLLLLSKSMPTRMEYREQLNKQRSLQRSEKQWFFAAVKIGAASNFLVDELLKTRAGENVLALLSTLTPHLAESEFMRVVTEIFVHFGIPAENIPGINQLSKIRSATITFSGRMDFKDRVLLTHGLFSSLNASHGNDPRISVPSPEILPRAINLLHKVATSKNYILHVCGFQGAAWVATYAIHILGLGTCAITPDGEVLAMTASHEHCKVVFFIKSEKNEITLWEEQKVVDLIRTNTSELRASDWLVCCDRVDYFQFHCANMKGQIDKSLAHFVTAKSFGAIHRFLKDIATPAGIAAGANFDSFIGSLTPRIEGRALKIIRRLGFSPETADFYRRYFRMPLWHEAFITPSQRPEAFTLEHKKLYFGAMFWTSHEAYVDLTSMNDLPAPNDFQQSESSLESLFKQIALHLASKGDFNSVSKNLDKLDMPRGLLNILNNVIEFASALAFTDWNRSNRTMSSSFFSGQFLVLSIVDKPPASDPYEALQQNIMDRVLQFSTNNSQEPFESSAKLIKWNGNLLGKDCGGIVVVRHLACSQDLFDLPGCLATFRPGTITVHGRILQEIRDQRSHDPWNTKSPESHVPLLMTKPPDSSFCSSDLFPRLRVQTVVRTEDDYVIVRPHLCIDSKTITISPISPSRIARNTLQLFVTCPCNHDDISRPVTRVVTVAGTESLVQWSAGLVLDKRILTGTIAQNTSDSVEGRQTSVSTTPIVQLHIQQVDNNRLGQWAATHTQDNTTGRPCLQILQQDACLDCIVSRLSPTAFGGRSYQVFIIPNTGSAGR